MYPSFASLPSLLPFSPALLSFSIFTISSNKHFDKTIYFILQAMLTQAEDPSIQVSITSLALPVVAIIYQVELTVNYKLLYPEYPSPFEKEKQERRRRREEAGIYYDSRLRYPIVSMIVVVVGIVVSKKHTLAREYSLMQPYRF